MKVLVAVDGSPASTKAVGFARALVAGDKEPSVTLFHVVDTLPEFIASRTATDVYGTVARDWADSHRSEGQKILASHIAKKAGNPTGDALRELYEQNVVGTGPYKFRSFDSKKSLELERFESYWGGRPFLDGTRVLFGLDRSTQQAGVIARERKPVAGGRLLPRRLPCRQPGRKENQHRDEPNP